MKRYHTLSTYKSSLLKKRIVLISNVDGFQQNFCINLEVF